MLQHSWGSGPLVCHEEEINSLLLIPWGRSSTGCHYVALWASGFTFPNCVRLNCRWELRACHAHPTAWVSLLGPLIRSSKSRAEVLAKMQASWEFELGYKSELAGLCRSRKHLSSWSAGVLFSHCSLCSTERFGMAVYQVTRDLVSWQKICD